MVSITRTSSILQKGKRKTENKKKGDTNEEIKKIQIRNKTGECIFAG